MDLSDTRIRAAKPSAKPYKLSDGGGLHLEVRSNGSKLWRLRYRLHGKENVFAIGEYPETSLAAARDEREAAKRLIKQGINPAHHRKLERLKAANASKDPFESLAREWTGRRAVESRWSESYKDSVRRVLEGDLFPSLSARFRFAISSPHICWRR